MVRVASRQAASQRLFGGLSSIASLMARSANAALSQYAQSNDRSLLRKWSTFSAETTRRNSARAPSESVSGGLSRFGNPVATGGGAASSAVDLRGIPAPYR